MLFSLSRGRRGWGEAHHRLRRCLNPSSRIHRNQHHRRHNQQRAQPVRQRKRHPQATITDSSALLSGSAQLRMLAFGPPIICAPFRYRLNSRAPCRSPPDRKTPAAGCHQSRSVVPASGVERQSARPARLTYSSRRSAACRSGR